MSNQGVSLRTGQVLSAPSGRVPDERPHKCGYCNNGTGILNPECPNARKEH